ncbi:MAG: OmpW family outer membrane protein [Pacificimonas sp.]
MINIAVLPTKLSALAIATAMTAFTPMAASAAEAGDIQVKLLGSGVFPQGDVDEVLSDPLGLTANADTNVTDSYVPTLAVEFFLLDNVSVETICCISRKDVEGQGALQGNELISNLLVIPATVTAKYHFDLPGGVKPYIGAGPTHFIIFDEGVGAGAAALGVDDVSLTSEWGVALQAGVDYALNDNGLGLTVDAKKYFVGTTAGFDVGDNRVLEADVELNTWIISGGLSFTF